MEVLNQNAFADQASPLQLALLVEDNLLAPDLFGEGYGMVNGSRRRLELIPECAKKRDEIERKSCCDTFVKHKSDLEYCYTSHALYPDCAILSSETERKECCDAKSLSTAGTQYCYTDILHK